MNSHELILGPVLSEKSFRLQSLPKKVYSLKVLATASKYDIKQSLQHTFGVKIESLTTCIVRGKIKRKARKKGGAPVQVKAKNYKKVFVTLKDGYSLPTVSDDNTKT